jgi:hypothetical protein
VIVSAELIGLIAAIRDCGTCRPFPDHCEDVGCRACQVEVAS